MIAIARLLLLAIWFGGGIFLAAVATPAAFAGAPDRTSAGNIAGLMIARWHYIALLAPALLLVTDWIDQLRRPLRIVLLVVAIATAAAQAGVDLKLRSMRAASAGSVQSLADSDRRTFGVLHGVSVGLLGAHLLAALGVIVLTAPSAGRN